MSDDLDGLGAPNSPVDLMPMEDADSGDPERPFRRCPMRGLTPIAEE